MDYRKLHVDTPKPICSVDEDGAVAEVVELKSFAPVIGDESASHVRS